MNRHLFCILYNQAKGGWVVVRESALAKGAVRYCGCIPMLMRCALAALTAFPPALLAQVVAAGDASPGRRPVLEAAGNGVPLVQIAAPDGAGLSDNHYRQFNVDGRGLILNNAPGGADTQLGGAVAANPQLGGAAARMILNQVLGTQPSQLEGFLEVAGQRADVIVANPNGIVCNGGGFINAGRGVLTTGVPVLGAQGGLEGFRVSAGVLEIGRDGLRGGQIDQVDLIARSLVVNGRIHSGGSLNVRTGANQVDYAGLGVQVLADAGGEPTVGIDVGRLGGMYAHQIHLVGTGAGVGVNSQGTLAAAGGGFTCTQQGRVVFTGTTTSAGDLAVSGAELVLDGATTHAGGDLALTATRGDLQHRQGALLRAEGRLAAKAAGTLRNDGAGISAGQVEVAARGLSNRGGGILQTGEATTRVRIAGPLDNRAGSLASAGRDFQLRAFELQNGEGGRIEHTGTGRLGLRSAGLDNGDGWISSRGEAGLTATGALGSSGRIQADGSLSLEAGSLRNTGGWILGLGPRLSLAAAGALENAPDGAAAGGVILGRGDLVLSAGQVANAGTVEGGPYVSVRARTLANAGVLRAGDRLEARASVLVANAQGLISAPAVALETPHLDNSRGKVEAHALDASVTDLSNAGGELTHLGSAGLALRVAGTLSNTDRGVIQSKAGDLTLSPGRLVNRGGTLAHAGAGTLAIRVGGDRGELDNRGGEISTKGALDLGAGHLGNRGGRLVAAGGLDAGALAGDIDNRERGLIAGATVRLDAGAGVLHNQGGTVQGRDGLILHAGRVDNDGGLLENTGAAALAVTARADLANGTGTIRSAGGTRLTAAGIENLDGRILGGAELAVRAGSLRNRGELAAPAVALDVPLLDNSDGKITQAGAGTFTLDLGDGAGTLINRSGAIRSEAGLEVSAGTVDNQGGTLEARRQVRVVASQGPLDNTAGRRAPGVIRGDQVHLEAQAGALGNEGGLIEGRRGVTLEVQSLGNAGGVVSSLEDAPLTVTARGALGNAGGLLGGNGRVAVAAGSIDNAGGTIHGGAALRVASGGELRNRGGALHSNGDLMAEAKGALDNAGARIEAGGAGRAGSTLALRAESIVNSGGRINNAGDGESRVAAAGRLSNDNAGKAAEMGAISGAGKLTVSAAELRNTEGGSLGATRELALEVDGLMVNRDGRVVAGDQVDLRAARLNNSSGRIGNAAEGTGSVRIQAPEGLNNQDGRIGSGADLKLTAGPVSGQGVIHAGQDASLDLQGDYTNPDGTTLTVQRDLSLTLTGTCENVGHLVAPGAITVNAAVVRNHGSAVIDGKRSEIKATGKLINQGRITGDAVTIDASGGAIVNQGGRVEARQELTVTGDHLDNAGGVLLVHRAPAGAARDGKGGLEVRVGKLDNTGGLVGNLGEQALTLSAGTGLNNERGELSGRGRVTVLAAELRNTQGGQISAGTDLTLAGGEAQGAGFELAPAAAVTNTHGRISAPGEVTVSAGRVDNSHGELGTAAGGSGSVQVRAAGVVTNAKGRIVAAKDLMVTAGELEGDGRLAGGINTTVILKGEGKLVSANRITAGRDLTLAAGQAWKNAGSLLALGTTRVQAADLHNQGPAVIDGGTTLVAATRKLVNEGRISGTAVALQAAGAHLDNQGGRVDARQALTVTADQLINKGGVLTLRRGAPARAAGGAGQETKGGGARSRDAAELEARQGLEVKVKSLDNRGGFVRNLGVQALTLTADTRLVNAGGELYGLGPVSVTAGRINNARGRLLGSSTLKVSSGGRLENTGGLLDGRHQLVAEAKGAVVNTRGRIISQGQVTVAASLLSNESGKLDAGTDLTLRGMDLLDNREGAAHARGNLVLESSAEVTNARGRIGAGGGLTLGLHSLDNAGGEIGSAAGAAGDVRITATGLVGNARGRLVAGKDLALTAGALVGDGQVAGTRDTSLTLTGEDPRASGNRISAGRDLRVTAAKAWANAGTLRAAGEVTVKAGAFSNQGSGLVSGRTLRVTGTGRLTNEGKARIHGEAVTLHSDQEIVNDGTVAALGTATLTSRGAIRNPAGTVSAQRDLELVAADIESKGQLGAGLDGEGKAVRPGNLTLTATRAFTVGGQSLAGGNIAFTGPALALAGATTRAHGNITLAAAGGAIEHQGGTLQAQGALRVTAASLSNRNGTITEAGQGDTRLELSGKLDNAAGTLASNARNFTIASGSLGNEQGGRLHHAGAGLLTLTQTGELRNAGTLASNGAALITAGRLDNEAGLLAARGAATVGGAQELRNAGGVIEAGAGLLLAGRTVSNDGGRMVALGGALELRETAELTNAAGTTFQGSGGGLISASTDTILQAGRIINGGSIVAARDLTLRETKELNNSGTLSAGGSLSAHAGAVTNAQGRMTAPSLDLRAGRLDNSRGQLTGTAVSGTVTDLINQDGRLTHLGTGAMTLAVSGTLINTDGGQIRSNGDLALRPQALDNSRGLIAQAATGTLALQVGADLGNAGGTIASNGGLSILARDIGNAGGTLRAGAVLDIRAGGTLGNQGGTLDTRGNVVVSATGALNNSAGRIQGGAEGSGSTLQVTAPALDNAGGRIVNAGHGASTLTGTTRISNSNASAAPDRGVIGGQGDVTISTPELLNTEGGQLVAGGSLALAADRLTNTAGRIHAQGHLTLEREGAAVDNARGELSAAGDVRLKVAGLGNTDGKVVAGQDLVLASKAMPADGSLGAGRDASFSFQDDYHLARGKSLTARRNLTLATAGTLTNAGRLEAEEGLTVRAGRLHNEASGLLYGRTARVAAGVVLTNHGKIYGTDVALGARSFTNGKQAASRPVSGGRRTWLSSVFSGLSASLESKAATGVVAAVHSLQIGAETVTNLGRDSLLTGGKALAIGGSLDDKHQAAGAAAQVDNSSATIQAVDGDLVIEAKAINNMNPDFATADAVVSRRRVNLYKALDNPVGPLGKTYEESQLKRADWGPYGATDCWYSAVGDFDGQIRLWRGQIDTDAEGRGHFTRHQKYEVTRSVTATTVTAGTPGRLLAGGNMHLVTGRILNDKSQIIAGRDMPVRWGSLINSEVPGKEVTTDMGITYRCSGYGPRHNGAPSPYNETKSVERPVLASRREAGRAAAMNAVPASGAAGAGGPVALPALRLSGNAGAAFPEAGAGAGLGTLAAAGGQAQGLGAAAPAIPDLRLPGGGLHALDASPTAPTLVVTDPDFLRGREVKGLEHMLDRLALDAGTTRKRLGDGHYETQVVSQQIVDLTGRPRLLPDSASAHGEFVALMDHGLAQAGPLELKAGAGLGASQQAALAQPSVWPVQQQVPLPDGRGAAVLVPKVYLTKEKADRLAPLGPALISAETMAGSLTGSLENSGTLMAERTLAVTASGIENSGRVQTTGAGSTLSLGAAGDLVHRGSIRGGQVELKAGGDLSMLASSGAITGTVSGGTNLSRVATVTAETLVATAGRDLKMVATQVQTSGAARLAAERDLSLETVGTSYHESVDHGRNYRHTSVTGVAGARLNVGGELGLASGRNLTATAAAATAEGALEAKAGGNLTLDAGRQTQTVDLGQFRTRSSFFSSSSEQTRDLVETDRAVGSQFSGDSVRFQAGGDIGVTAGAVAGRGQVAFDAAGSIELKAGTDTQHTSRYSHKEESGFLSGGSLGITFGSREQTDQFDQHDTLQSQSRTAVGSLEDSATFNAGARVQVSGSDLVAGQNLRISGGEVTLDPGRDLSVRHEVHEFRQTGLSIGLGGGVVDAAQGLVSHAQAATETKGPGRVGLLHGLAAANLGRDLARQAGKAQEALASQGAGGAAAASGIKLQASIGTSSSRSESTERTLTHLGSTATAAGDVAIASRGDFKGAAVTLKGKDISLEAGGNLELTAAADASSSRGSNSSSSASLGVSAGVGRGSAGLSIDIAASRGAGSSHGDGTAQQISRVAAEGTFMVRSGGDAALTGVQASGEAIRADVGGNLRLASLQDTFTHASTQQSAGVSMSIPVYGGGFSASASLAGSRARGDFQAVGEQTRLDAGAGGLQLSVRKGTTLEGAAITSTAPAALNSLATGTLEVKDLDNRMSASASSSGFSAGTASVSSLTEGIRTAGGALFGQGDAQRSGASTTCSVIAPGAVTITDEAAQDALTGRGAAETVAGLRRDAEGSHTALERPDMAGLQAEADAAHAAATLAINVAATAAGEVQAHLQRQVAAPAPAPGGDPGGDQGPAPATAPTADREAGAGQEAATAGSAVAGGSGTPGPEAPGPSGPAEGSGWRQAVASHFGSLKVCVPPCAEADFNPEDYSPDSSARFTRFFADRKAAAAGAQEPTGAAPGQAFIRMSNGELKPVVLVAGVGGDLLRRVKDAGAATVTIVKAAGTAMKDFSDGATTGYVNSVTLGVPDAVGLTVPPKNFPAALGRVVGDGVAMVQGVVETGAGAGGGIAGLATGPGELVIAPVAAGVAAHGAGTIVTAATDAGKILASAMSKKPDQGGGSQPETKAGGEQKPERNNPQEGAGFTGGNSSTQGTVKIGKNKVRVDVEEPTGGSTGNVHIQVKGAGAQRLSKVYIRTMEDFEKLPGSMRNIQELRELTKKALIKLEKMRQ